jgi:quinol-cytochrome oxidoreductase complex cytochrome b subunit
MVIQIVTGLILALHYNNGASLALAEGTWASSIDMFVNHNYTGLFHYVHAVLPSTITLLMYYHMTNNMVNNSTNYSPETFYTGVLLIIVMMAVSALGYVIVYGNMSHWAAIVIINLGSIVPGLVETLFGGAVLGTNTISVFYALHFLLGLFILRVMVMHFGYLHNNGNSGLVPATGHVSFAYGSAHSYLNTLAVAFAALLFGMGLMEFTESVNMSAVDTGAAPAAVAAEIHLSMLFAVVQMSSSSTIGVLLILMTIATVLNTGNVTGTVSNENGVTSSVASVSTSVASSVAASSAVASMSVTSTASVATSVASVATVTSAGTVASTSAGSSTNSVVSSNVTSTGSSSTGV